MRGSKQVQLVSPKVAPPRLKGIVRHDTIRIFQRRRTLARLGFESTLLVTAERFDFEILIRDVQRPK